MIGGDVGPGLHPVQCELRVRTEVGLIVRPELAHGRVGGGQVVEQLLHGGEVLEVPGRLLDQVVIDRGQTGGQRVRDLGRVQVLGQQRAAQRQQQVEKLGVALPAEAEEAVVDEVAVLGRGPPPGVRLEDGAELAFGQRAGVSRQQPEVHADPFAGDEERHPHAVGVPVGAHSDDQRDGLGAGLVGVVGVVGLVGAAGCWSGPGPGELHPDVAVFGFLTAEQQVGLHRPVLAGERVEAAGVGHPVEDEREEDFERLGLARAVVTAQGEAAVGERPLLVHVVPDVDNAGPERLDRPVIVDVTADITAGVAANVGAEQVECELALGVPDRERGLDVPVARGGREHQDAGVDPAEQPQVGQERDGRVQQPARIMLPGRGERRGPELVVELVDHGAQPAVGDEGNDGRSAGNRAGLVPRGRSSARSRPRRCRRARCRGLLPMERTRRAR